MKISPQMCLRTRKNWLNLRSHPHLDPDVGFKKMILAFLEQADRILILPHMYFRTTKSTKTSVSRTWIRIPDQDRTCLGGGLRSPSALVKHGFIETDRVVHTMVFLEWVINVPMCIAPLGVWLYSLAIVSVFCQIFVNNIVNCSWTIYTCEWRAVNPVKVADIYCSDADPETVRVQDASRRNSKLSEQGLNPIISDAR